MKHFILLFTLIFTVACGDDTGNVSSCDTECSTSEQALCSVNQDCEPAPEPEPEEPPVEELPPVITYTRLVVGSIPTTGSVSNNFYSDFMIPSRPHNGHVIGEFTIYACLDGTIYGPVTLILNTYKSSEKFVITKPCGAPTEHLSANMLVVGPIWRKYSLVEEYYYNYQSIEIRTDGAPAQKFKFELMLGQWTVTPPTL